MSRHRTCLLSIWRLLERTFHTLICQARNQKFILGFFSRTFPFFSSPFLFLYFPRLEVAPQIQLRDLGSVLAAPVGKNDICSQQTRSLSSKYTKHAFAVEPRTHTHFGVSLYYLEPRERAWLVAVNVVLFLSNKKMKQIWLFLNLPWREGHSHLLNSTWLLILHFISGGVFNTLNTELVTALHSRQCMTTWGEVSGSFNHCRSAGVSSIALVQHYVLLCMSRRPSTSVCYCMRDLHVIGMSREFAFSNDIK